MRPSKNKDEQRLAMHMYDGLLEESFSTTCICYIGLLALLLLLLQVKILFL